MRNAQRCCAVHIRTPQKAKKKRKKSPTDRWPCCCLQSFVTVMDIFHMNISVVDKMYADIADLASHLSQLDNLPPDHESKATVNKWCGGGNGKGQAQGAGRCAAACSFPLH